MAAKNTLVVGFKETKDVLTLVIALGRAYENAKADGEVNWADIQHLLPVLFLIGPALDNFENVQLELKMASKEEGEELKQWVNDQIILENKTTEEFIEASFAIVLDIWMVFRTFFFPGDKSMFKNSTIPTQPEAPKEEADGNVAEDKGPYEETVGGTSTDEVPVDSAKPSAE